MVEAKATLEKGLTSFDKNYMLNDIKTIRADMLADDLRHNVETMLRTVKPMVEQLDVAIKVLLSMKAGRDKIRKRSVTDGAE